MASGAAGEVHSSSTNWRQQDSAAASSEAKRTKSRTFGRQPRLGNKAPRHKTLPRFGPGAYQANPCTGLNEAPSNCVVHCRGSQSQNPSYHPTVVQVQRANTKTATNEGRVLPNFNLFGNHKLIAPRLRCWVGDIPGGEDKQQRSRVPHWDGM